MSADLIARLRACEKTVVQVRFDTSEPSFLALLREAADALEARPVARSTGLLDPDMPAQQLRLMFGELDADNALNVRAGIRAANTAVEARIASVRDESVEECARVEEGRSPFDQKVQGLRCSCRGADEWCPCQNVPDRATVAAHRAAKSEGRG